MKRYLILILLLIPIYSFCQSGKSFDSRLLVKYSENYLTSLSENNPETIKYLNYTIDNCYQIIDATQEKIKDYPYLHEINNSSKFVSENVLTVSQLPNMNVYNYDFKQDLNSNTIYRIKDSNTKAIVFISKTKLANKFNAIN